MRTKSGFTGIAVLAVVLLVLSITMVSRVWSANPGNLARGVSTKPMAAKFLPKRSPLVSSFLVNPEKLARFTQLAVKPGDRAHLRQDLADLKRQLEQRWLLNYDRDVSAWLDQEITIAVTTTDLDRLPENGLQPGYLLALATKDANLTKKQIESFWQRQAQAGADLEFEQYQGVAIIATKPNSQKTSLAGSVFGKFALFANDTRVIRNAINDLQVPDLSLSSLASYQQGLQKLEAPFINVSFINVAELGKWGSEKLPKSLQDLPTAGVTLGLGLEPSGIRAETVLNLEQPTSFSPTPAHTLGAVKFMPLGSSHLVGYGLDRTWQELQATLQTYPAIATGFKSFSTNLNTNLGVDLEKEILPWITGEYAFGILSDRAKSPNWVLAVQNHEPAKVDAAIAHLDELAHTGAKLTVGEVQVNGQALTVWTQLSATAPKRNLKTAELTGNVVAVHTKVAGYTLLASSVEAINAALAALKSPAIAPLPANAEGYAHFDRQFDLAWLETEFPLVSLLDHSLKLIAAPMLSHVQAVNLVSLASPMPAPDAIRHGQVTLVLDSKP